MQQQQGQSVFTYTDYPASQGTSEPGQVPGPGYQSPTELQDVGLHSGGDPERAAENAGGDMASFGEKAIRLAFIKKVCGILALQLLVTLGIISVFLFVKPVQIYCAQHRWVYITASCVYIGMTIVLMCVQNIRRKFPINLICLMIFTIALSVLLGSFAGAFDTKEILIAVGITLAIVVVMAILGIQQKFDFTYCLGIATVLIMTAFMYGMMCLIFRANFNTLLYASLGALAFSLFLLVDIQSMVGGKHKAGIDPEEYIFAALNIYLDIVNILIFVLMIVKGNS